jgi:GT2 family glycosyltransferase
MNKLVQQSYPLLKVIVVDSNSSDGTADAVRQTYPDTTVLSGSDRDFWAGATNIGLRHALQAGSEWVLTINDDAVIEKDYAERLLAIAKRNNCLILGSQINHLSEPELIWALGTFTTWGGSELLRLGWHGALNRELGAHWQISETIPVDALPGNGVLVHNSVFRRIGLYNNYMLPHYHADSELIMRAAATGIRAWATPRVILLNDFSPKQKKPPLGGLRGIAWSLFHPKSHLYLPALLYIWVRYCPSSQRVPTAILLILRFLGIAKNESVSIQV